MENVDFTASRSTHRRDKAQMGGQKPGPKSEKSGPMVRRTLCE
jgi:hypothetical protein